MTLRQSRNIRIEDVTLFAAPGLGVESRYMDGDNYYRYKIARGPRPAGATQDRLLSTSADGFNYAFARKGPTLDHCDFSYEGDDSVNLHGPALPITRIDGATIWALWGIRRLIWLNLQSQAIRYGFFRQARFKSKTKTRSRRFPEAIRPV